MTARRLSHPNTPPSLENLTQTRKDLRCNRLLYVYTVVSPITTHCPSEGAFEWLWRQSVDINTVCHPHLVSNLSAAHPPTRALTPRTPVACMGTFLNGFIPAGSAE